MTEKVIAAFADMDHNGCRIREEALEPDPRIRFRSANLRARGFQYAAVFSIRCF
jgi:hypothetical protein